MTLPRTCCCSSCGICCPCHPVYGYRTSWLLTWTGSVSYGPPTCACMVSIANSIIPPDLSETAITSTTTVSGATLTFSFANPFDQLNCAFGLVAGPTFSAVPSDIYLIAGSTCTYDSAWLTLTPTTGVVFSVRPPQNRSCTSPDPCSPRVTSPQPWRIYVSSYGISWIWTGSFDCDNPGTFTLQSTYGSTGCNIDARGRVVDLSASAGTVTLT